MAEHMLILKLISPENKAYYVAAAFPAACGKTNSRCCSPPCRAGGLRRSATTSPGCGSAGRPPVRHQPRVRLLRRRAGHQLGLQPQRDETIAKGNTVFTNVAKTDDGDVWWEGLRAIPTTSSTGRATTGPRVRGQGRAPEFALLHPDLTVPDVGPEWDDPQGVPISAILFGGRRKTTVPLVSEATDWQHGVFIGSTIGSEQTAAAEGKVGAVRRDPMAMLPFIGYNVGDYFQHWINIGKNADESKLPKVFFVNWFRRGDDGRFPWPGFGENSRVLKRVIERIEGTASGRPPRSVWCRRSTTST